MTTYPLAQPSQPGRLLWMQHHPWRTMLLLVGVWTAAFLLPSSNLLVWPTMLAAVGLGIAQSASSSQHHKLMPCPRCSFAPVPIDPEAEVDRKQWQLRALHALAALAVATTRLIGMRFTQVVATLSWLAGWYVAIVYGMIHLSSGGSRGSEIPVGFIVILLIEAIFAQCVITHNRLLLWCPWCRHHGGGDDEVIMAPPLPVGTGTRSS